MIEINALFTMQSVKDMYKGKRISNFIIFPLFSAVLLAGGIASLIRKVTGMELVMAIIMLVACPLILVLTFYMTNSELKNNQKAFGVDKGEVQMNYKFSANGVLVTRVAEGKKETETLYFRELYKVKRTKKCFLMYVNKDEMFYVPATPDCFVSGSADELFKLFYDSKVILDY